MTKEMEFFSFLMEQYAAYKQTTANQVLAILEEKELSDTVFGMYERYHVEGLQNAFDDIDSLIAKK